MIKINYQLMLDEKLKELAVTGIRPKLLLHSCCAPCSTYVLEFLASYFDITCFFYNPNISPEDEYFHRAEELLSLPEKMKLPQCVKVVIADYAPESFSEIAKGRENIPEGGERCFDCYRLRLRATAKYAKANGFDTFTTTLSISPHKNADKLNLIGKALGEEFSVPYLFSDFKKKNGYRRSCIISAEIGLYRQDYCGCIYSKLQAERRRTERE